MGKKVALHNLGCKVNAYEVEAMQQLLEEAGYEIVPFEPGADVYLINTYYYVDFVTSSLSNLSPTYDRCPQCQ